MKIKTLRTYNFQGLQGKHTYDVQQINAFVSGQGTGKTSILNAIMYALTGKVPEGEQVYKNADKCAVELEFADGTSISRQKMANGSSSCYLNRKKSTIKATEEMVEQVTGADMAAVKVASSAEILKNMKPSALGDLILKYTNETLTTERVLGYATDMSAAAKNLASKGLPAGEYGLPQVKRFYQEAIEKRRDAKKIIANHEALIRSMANITLPSESMAVLAEQKNRLILQQEEERNYATLRRAYDQAIIQKNRRDANIADLRQKIAAIGEVSVSAQEKQAASDALQAIREKKASAKEIGNAQYAIIQDTKKMLDTLNTRICPLSSKLVCTTDKTPIRDELEAIVAKAQEALTVQKNLYNSLSEDEKKAELTCNALLAAESKQREKATLITQLGEWEKTTVTIPKEPVKPDNSDTTQQLALVEAKIKAIETYAYIGTVEKELKTAREKLKLLESICKAFDPKGIVMEGIISDYMTAFEQVINEKAEALRPGMRMRFVSDGGVRVLTDVHGNGKYLDYSSLSGGEKAMYIYLMLDMFNGLSNLHVLILDELSVLDRDTFEALIALVQTHATEYDHVFLAAIDHKDTLEVLEKHGIPVTNAAKLAV